MTENDVADDAELQHGKKFPEADAAVFAVSFTAVFMLRGDPLDAIIFGGLLTLNFAIIYRYVIKRIFRIAGVGVE